MTKGPLCAAVCRSWGDPSVLTVETLARRPMADGQIRVAVRAVGLGFADVLLVAGRYQLRPPFPFAPGMEIAGEVTEVGRGCAATRAGDRVVAVLDHGGAASEVVVEHNDAHALPADIPFAVGAALPVAYGTAELALVGRAALRSGEALLVRGAGSGVGLAAVEIGRILGARVIAIAGSSEKRALAAARGAHHVLGADTRKLREAVLDLTNGRGADVVFDPVGTNFLEVCLRCVAWGGRILLIGFAGGVIPQISAHSVLNRQASVLGVAWGQWRRRAPEAFGEHLRRILDWRRAGSIEPFVQHSRGLSAVASALTAIAQRQLLGKAVVTVAAAPAGGSEETESTGRATCLNTNGTPV